MPDAAAVLVGVMAAALGSLMASGPARDRVDTVEITAVAVVALGWSADLLSAAAVAAVAIVIVGARLAARWTPLAAVAAVGAALVVWTEVPGDAHEAAGWVAGLATLALVVLGRLARSAFGATPALALVTWIPLAAYLATPDTESVTVVGAAFAVVTFVVALRQVDVSVGAIDAVAVVAVAAIVSDGVERDASYVVLSAAAPLLHAAALELLGRRVVWRPVPAAVFVVLHLLVGVAAARWAALGASWSVNAGRAGVLIVGAVVAVGPLVWHLSEPTDMAARPPKGRSTRAHWSR